jgi:hypothetical protein
MKLFKCQACGNILYFENRICGRCGHRLAYLPEQTMLSALEPAGDLWTSLAAPGQQRFLCHNASTDACNWLVPPGTNDALCVACRHNGMIPDLTDPSRLAAWQQIELAKHRLFYSLLSCSLSRAQTRSLVSGFRRIELQAIRRARQEAETEDAG